MRSNHCSSGRQKRCTRAHLEHPDFSTGLQLPLKCCQPAPKNSIQGLQHPHYLFLYLDGALNEHQSPPRPNKTDKSQYEAKKEKRLMEWKDGIQIRSIEQLRKSLSSFWRDMNIVSQTCKAVIHPRNTICNPRGWQTAGVEPTTRFLLSAAQEWICSVYSRAIDSLIRHGCPPEGLGWLVGGDWTHTYRETYLWFKLPPTLEPRPINQCKGSQQSGWRSHFNMLIYTSWLISDIMKENTHDVRIGHNFSLYWADGGRWRAGSADVGGVCVMSPVANRGFPFGSHAQSILLKWLTVSVNDKHCDEDQLTHSSGFVTVYAVEDCWITSIVNIGFTWEGCNVTH